jgi:tRNA(Ile)-lysidine synthase
MASGNSALLQQTRSDLTHFFEQNQAETYLLAVSGGLDSMVLCALLHELQLPIKILHVNYGLRGTESDADQVFVTAYCQKHHIELEVHEVGLKNQLANNKLNLQAEARRIRYAFFKEVQAQTPNSLLCTAHQADDQIETFWLQLARGAGLKGLAGMARQSENLLRPLLHLTRSEVLALAKEMKVTWREDSSNASLKYRRNLWRHEFLPYLNTKSPGLNHEIALIQKVFTREIEGQEAPLKQAIRNFNLNQSISLVELSQLSAYQFIELFKNSGVPTHVIRRISELFQAENGKYISWKNGKDQKSYYFIKHQQQIQLYSKEPFVWHYSLHPVLEKEGLEQQQQLVDMDLIKGQPYFRAVQMGDSISISGMKGSKKVLQILKEAGVPAPLRKQQIILCDDQKVLAVPTLQINAQIKAHANTTQFATLCFSKILTFEND